MLAPPSQIVEGGRCEEKEEQHRRNDRGMPYRDRPATDRGRQQADHAEYHESLVQLRASPIHDRRADERAEQQHVDEHHEQKLERVPRQHTIAGRLDGKRRRGEDHDQCQDARPDAKRAMRADASSRDERYLDGEDHDP